MLVFILVFIFSCQQQVLYETSEAGFKQFINDFEKEIEPLFTKYGQTQWDAYITGKSELFDLSTQLSLQIDSIYQNTAEFNYLKNLKEKDVISNAVLKRQLDILYKSYLSKQINPELNKQITEISTKLQNTFGNFRAEVDGKKLSDNDVTQILKKNTDSQYREKVWRAQKSLGNLVSKDIVDIAKLRNKAAKELGYDNYYLMSMELSELDPNQVENTFDELYTLSEKPFKEIHSQIESIFAKRYKIKIEDIRSWHYEDLFSQKAPGIFDINLDEYFAKINIPEYSKKYFSSFNMQVDDIIARSDLYEKEGKNQHAYSFNIDRKQDIRILCNIEPNMRWMETMLHELGHATYDKYIDQSLPYLLREPANQLTTEGIAMLFGGFASNVNWMKESLSLSKKEAQKIKSTVEQNSRLSKLIFARWSMVVFNFEKSFYANPDQDLNKLWWDLVEKYQFIKRPENPVRTEWATKMHIAMYPVYYQNYQLGEIFASQVLNFVTKNFYDNINKKAATFWNKGEAGDYLVNKIYNPGKKLEWNEMIKAATGEYLTAKYFVEQYVN
jgi:peptidyl-dipeptidase A